MDILADYNAAILARLNGNAFMADGVPAVVVGEDTLALAADDDATDDERRKAISDKLNGAGVIGLLSVPELVAVKDGLFSLNSSLEWQINKTRNNSDTGAKKTGGQLVLYTIGSLNRWTIPITNDNGDRVDPYGELTIKRAEYVGEDKSTAIWAIDFESKIRISR